MAISIKRYIDIVSGVGAGVRVPGRELIGRIFTTNALVPTDTVVEFESPADGADFFGSDSEEYRRMAFYFGFISKTQVRARKIGFVRYTPAAVAPTLRGVFAVPALAEFQAITDGSLIMTLAGNAKEILGLNFSGATSYADVASILQSAIREAYEDALWAASLVAFDSRLKTFVFTGGMAGAAEIEAATDAESGTALAGMLRWSAASGALASKGYDATSVTDTLNHSADADNNFGSFLFMANLSMDEMAEAASFAHLSNIQFMYCQRVGTENAAGARAALQHYDGTALTEYNPKLTGEFPEMAPMILLAATDYTRLNGTQNYMFQQFGLTPTVTDNTKANLLDDLRVNYYGRTQQAGQTIDFYQRGVLQGSVQDMNIYANEMWLKDRAGADLMTLLLALPKISANDTGSGQVLGCLQNVIDMGLNNGSISVNKPLNYTQKAFITQITGDDTAWIQVQTQGWWLNAEVEEYTVDDRVEYKIVYLLIYSKDDVIRKVEGTHSLI
ncbi:DUF3383 domain-containing protein [Desulfovibrio sp. OttesenSCG-928-C14]|nr:DUF3383 domain-containing protein [Desulfovibrio sp. OttesenSCG-928-C14]